MITPPGEKCGLFDSLVSVLFPATCVVCQCPVEALGCGVVCRPCWQRVGQLDGFLCDLCGYAFASRNLPAGTMLCAACRRGFFSFDFARSYGRLEDPLQEIIHQFKYGSHPSLARPLARLLHALWVQDCRDLAPDMILPVPLHKARQRERGFNQAWLLARHLSRWTQVPLLDRVLVRHRSTTAQAGLSRKQRRRNIQGAFRVADRAAIRGRAVLLVDDVFTTGATLNECARILRKQGAHRVDVVTIARVVAWSIQPV